MTEQALFTVDQLPVHAIIWQHPVDEHIKVARHNNGALLQLWHFYDDVCIAHIDLPASSIHWLQQKLFSHAQPVFVPGQTMKIADQQVIANENIHVMRSVSAGGALMPGFMVTNLSRVDDINNKGMQSFGIADQWIHDLGLVIA